jgi:CHAT domain-containing protein
VFIPTPLKKIPTPLKKMLTIENPLIRSGLALVGANNALKLEKEESQGLFTAEKSIGLQLIGTELVVLSACDTGVGEVQNGEGVYGLRRAFVQAGTKSLVMSMWKVPDTETKELMVLFYKNIKSGMNRCQALRQAALHQKKIVKKRYGKDKPSYWGAFLFLGES